MKKIIVLCIALTLGGCASNPFAPVVNPINNNNLYEGELVFDAALKTFIGLKKACAMRALPPACRTYVNQGRAILPQIYAADRAARDFVKNNPTLDATNAVQAFTGLVATFRDTVTALSASK